MATTIKTHRDTIKIDKAFVSGKDRVAVNGNVVFEVKLRPGTAQEFNAGTRKYTIESRIVSKMTCALAIHLQYDAREAGLACDFQCLDQSFRLGDRNR